MIDNPVEPIIDGVRSIALGNSFHQISFGDDLLIGAAPLFAPFRGKGGIRLDGDQVDGGIGGT